MTNREWLESLTDEEFAKWLIDDLAKVKSRSNNTREDLPKWLKETYFDMEDFLKKYKESKNI